MLEASAEVHVLSDVEFVKLTGGFTNATALNRTLATSGRDYESLARSSRPLIIDLSGVWALEGDAAELFCIMANRHGQIVFLNARDRIRESLNAPRCAVSNRFAFKLSEALDMVLVA